MEDLTMEEMKLIGLPQSFKPIFTWKAIFAQITLTIILPLSLIIITNPFLLKLTFTFTSFVFEPIATTFTFFAHIVTTASLAHTTASSNTPRDDLNYNKVMKALHKGMRRLVLTLLLMYFLTFFAYNLMLAVILPYTIVVVWCAILTTYHLGLVYVVFVWQLAVLEGRGWLKAMVKWPYVCCSILTGILVNLFLMYPLMMNVGEKSAPIRIMLVVLLVSTFLLHMVIPTKFYLIWKSVRGSGNPRRRISVAA